MDAEDALEERRLFPRLYISLPFEYQALLSDSGEFLSDSAFLRDISLTGLHFLCETLPKLNPGDIADFTFKFQQSDLNPLIINEIRATGLVKRIEPPLEESPQFGVVVEFLSGPIFKHADY
jgi:hypothetical protein